MREINTKCLVGNTPKVLNAETTNGKEFNGLLKDISDQQDVLIDNLSEKLDISTDEVSNVISDTDDYTYTQPIPEQIEDIVREMSKYYEPPKPGDKLNMYRIELENLKFYDDDTFYNDDDGTSSDIFPEIPDNVIEQVAESIVDDIRERLREKAAELKEVVIPEQDLGEWSGLLHNSASLPTDQRIGTLEREADRFGLKALNVHDVGLEQVYKNPT